MGWALAGLLVALASVVAVPGFAGVAMKTKRVSVSSTGAQADGGSGGASISANGRFVAFASGATNLAGGDTNGYQDVFVRDLGSHTTKRVSLSSTGAQGDGHSFDPAISADGQLVAFASLATNLVGADTNGDRDIFVRNLRTHRTRRVSVSSAGAQGDGDSFEPTISANGRFVAFASDATNLVGGDTNAHTDVFVRNLRTRRTKRVSVSSAGAQGDGNSFAPTISANGRFVAYASSATNLVGGDTNSGDDVFLRDRKTGKTRLLSRSSGGVEGNGFSDEPSISADGRFVAFASDATNLVGDDTNAHTDVFVRNLRTRRTQRVSLSSARAQGDSGSFLVADPSSISADGRFVSFISAATNLVAGDTNAKDDVFLRDRKSRKTRLLSRSLGGGFGNGTSINPAISADGRFVAFASDATNLIGHDTNGLIDVFVRGPLR